MFVLSPLHRRFMELRRSHQVAIIIGGAILASIVQRPLGNDNAFQSVVFYMPLYLSGLFLSLHRETLLPVLSKKWWLFLIVAVLIAALQSAAGQSGNMHKPFFAIQGVELMGFQKLALAAALFGLFASFSSPPGRIVDIIAETSFAIFFLHPFVLRFFGATALFQLSPLGWLNLAIATTAIITLCILVALALRYLLKAKSKYVIGI